MKVLNAILLVLFISSASARVGPPHRVQKAQNGKGIPGEYVVIFNNDVEPRGILRGFINSQVLNVYEHAVKGFTVRMNLNALLNALENVYDVTIEENEFIYVSDVQMLQQPPVDSWGLDRVDQVADTNGQYSYERDGSTVDVYIVDTGIDRNHEDFGGRASFGTDVSGKDEGDNDYNGHGTHVAGKFAWLLLSFIMHSILIL
jgi:subtilisin family serine protease